MSRLSAFNVVAMQGAFASGLDTAPTSWAADISEPIRDTANLVDLVDFIPPGVGKKTTGSRGRQRGEAKSLPLTNERYTNQVTIPVEKWTADKVGMWARNVEELARESVLLWDPITLDVLNANSTKSINGVALFNSNNTVTGNTYSGLTVEKAASDINKLVAKMKSRNINGGAPRNASMKNLVLLTGNGDLAGVLSAAVAQAYLAGGQTNPVNSLGLNIQVISDPRATAGNYALALRADKTGPKPFFLTEQLFIEDYADENSDFFRDNAEYFYGYQTWRACGGGDDMACGKITFG